MRTMTVLASTLVMLERIRKYWLSMRASRSVLVVNEGSPGLVVMGDHSCSKGRGFESRRRILDGLTFFHIDLL